MKTSYLESNLNAYQLETVNTIKQQQQEQLHEQQPTTDSSSTPMPLSLSQRKRDLSNETNVIVPDSPMSLRTISSQKPILDILPSPISPRFNQISHLPSLTTSDGSHDHDQYEEYEEYLQFEGALKALV
ncbi:1326_t:CDS:2 [Acaulospora colombiana]|uniref:1326_t:CDS:1 n=1 Tax=Acaulospora colombiana TaxID=27376 RepID=A0ACA9K8A3_9GLOM|nr:1326_t:CDS:2 [Acaulospora colombiana]